MKALRELAEKAGGKVIGEAAVLAEGDAAKRRHLLPRCKATRPSIASSTKEDSIAPNTNELAFSAMPRLDNSNVKVYAEEGDDAYNAWYGTAPYEPGQTIE